MVIDFILGILAGVCALSILTINKFRFSIAEKKLTSYEEIMSHSSVCFLLAVNDDDFEASKDRLAMCLCKKSMYITDSALVKTKIFISSLSAGSSDDITSSYLDIRSTIQSELDIRFLSKINELLSNPAKIDINVALSSLANKMGSRTQQEKQ